MSEQLELYVVKSKDGKYFRSRGAISSRFSWVDHLKEAKIYSKIGPARSQVTYWSSHYPEYGTPYIVILTIAEEKILDEDERVKNSIFKIAKREIERKIKYAKYEFNKIQERVKNENSKTLETARNKIKMLEEQLTNLS